MKLRSTHLWPLFLFISFSFAEPCTPSLKPKPPEPGPTDVVYEVQTVLPRFEERAREATGKGIFTASDKLVVKSENSGVLEKVLVHEGDHVNVGDILAQFRNEGLSTQLEQKQNELKELQEKIDRDKQSLDHVVSQPPPEPREIPENIFLDEDSLDKPSTVTEPSPKYDAGPSRAELDARILASQAQIDKLTLEISDLESAIQKLTLNASIAGVIQKKHVTDGSLVAIGETLFEIVALDPITLVFNIPAEVGSYVDKLIPVKAAPVSAPELQMEGSLFSISPSVDSQTQTLEIKGNFTNDRGLIREGQEGIATLTTRKVEKTLIVPRKAVVQEQNKTYLFVAFGNRAQKNPVELGEPVGTDEVQIKANLRIDEPVVVSGPQMLQDGSFIKVLRQDQPAPAPQAPTVSSLPAPSEPLKTP